MVECFLFTKNELIVINFNLQKKKVKIGEGRTNLKNFRFLNDFISLARTRGRENEFSCGK
jgi:hypothetical protein